MPLIQIITDDLAPAPCWDGEYCRIIGNRAQGLKVLGDDFG